MSRRAKFLTQDVFAGQTGIKLDSDPKDVAGFDTFIERYINGLAIERAAMDYLKA